MKTTIVAVGNCGYNIANDIIEAGIIIPKDYIVCGIDNSELHDKEPVKKIRTVLLPSFGGHPNADILAFVSGIVQDDAELVVICAGMGGRTGSSYAPLIAMDAKRKSKIVISVCAKAFNFEGQEVQNRAKRSFLRLQNASDFCLSQDNNNLTNELIIDDMNKPLICSLKILDAKSPISDWPKIPISDLEDMLMETSKKYCQVSIHNLYNK